MNEITKYDNNSLDNMTDVDIATMMADDAKTGINNLDRSGKSANYLLNVRERTLTEVSEMSGLPKPFISVLNRIGNKTLYYPLLLKNSAGFTKLEKCTYDVQVRYCEQPVDLLIDRNGEYDSLKVDVDNLSSDQAKQVFSDGNIRSLPAQRAYLESLTTYGNVRNVHLDYLIEGKTLVVLNKTKFTKRQLTKILETM